MPVGLQKEWDLTSRVNRAQITVCDQESPRPTGQQWLEFTGPQPPPLGSNLPWQVDRLCRCRVIVPQRIVARGHDHGLTRRRAAAHCRRQRTHVRPEEARIEERGLQRDHIAGQNRTEQSHAHDPRPWPPAQYGQRTRQHWQEGSQEQQQVARMGQRPHIPHRIGSYQREDESACQTEQQPPPPVEAERQKHRRNGQCAQYAKQPGRCRYLPDLRQAAVEKVPQQTKKSRRAHLASPPVTAGEFGWQLGTPAPHGHQPGNIAQPHQQLTCGPISPSPLTGTPHPTHQHEHVDCQHDEYRKEVQVQAGRLCHRKQDPGTPLTKAISGKQAGQDCKIRQGQQGVHPRFL